MSDDHPELAGYEPGDGRPLRSRRLLIMMRVIVIVGIVALVLPGIVTIVTVGSSTASRACALWVERLEPGATGSSARFELFGPGGVGWQCYTTGLFGGDVLVASLGPIPSGARLPVSVPDTINS
ncbi:hypothetical protein [Marisediminicola senii]|uniref:hypothetical protein n=1 Tax=Marisediminicola senii TaxID=2711233 RepID=UPI0013EDA08C|nr:hypothetical protein [Marisediminicola senii]